MSSTRIKAGMDTSDRGLWHSFKAPGVVTNSLTGTKSKQGQCLFVFKLELNTLGFKCKGLRSGEREGCTSNTVCGHIFKLTFFPCFDMVNSLLMLVPAFLIQRA
jgi:hypothetical protein